MRRADAITLLKKIDSEKVINPNWISLTHVGSGRYELRLKREDLYFAFLKQIVEKCNLRVKEDDGLWAIYGEGNAEIQQI